MAKKTDKMDKFVYGENDKIEITNRGDVDVPLMKGKKKNPKGKKKTAAQQALDDFLVQNPEMRAKLATLKSNNT